MKKIFTLISAMAITLSLFAQQDESARRGFRNQGRLSVSTAINTPIKLLIDGRNYSSFAGDQEIFVSDLRAGYHNIKVYQQKADRYNTGRRSGKLMQLVYEANLYVKPQYHIDISINRFGRTFMDERQMNQAYYAEYNDDDRSNDWDNSNAIQPMDSRTFEQFKGTLRNESFDNTKVTLAKQTIAANYFLATQVKEMVNLLSYDDNKLDIAKYSYKYTIDKNNYFLLNDAFSYSSSKEELAKYIESYR
ncbi:hypothetical protein BH11BAC4_BH11BAC4_13730 [soil metagenome]